MVIPTDLRALVEEDKQLKERLAIALQENTQAREKMNSVIGDVCNLNELNKTTSSRTFLPFEKKVEWYDHWVELEENKWEYKKEYELDFNPQQENLVKLVDMFIENGYKVSISDPHMVLSLSTELQSYNGKWFVGWDQELHVHARKIDEEVLVKKEVFWCGPVTPWYTGVHYLVDICKNKSKIDDKILLNFIKYGETNPSFILRMAKQGTADKHIFDKWAQDYVNRNRDNKNGKR